MRLAVVRFERLRRGIKTRELSEKTGIPVPRYIHFENGGKYRRLSEEELSRIAECLQISREVFADAKGAALMMP